MSEQTAMPAVKKTPKEPAVELVDAADMLRLEVDGMKSEIFKLREENAKLLQQLVAYENVNSQRALRDKYKLGPNDKVDPATLRIIRG